MTDINNRLNELFERVPRRHTIDNVKEMLAILDEYETLLQDIEAENEHYEKQVAPFFDAIDPVKMLVKRSSDNKASKKTKDALFDEASVALKDALEDLQRMYMDGGTGNG